MKEITYADAIREGLREELLRDSNVIILGEDVGAYGGAYKVTRGFLEEFGPTRIMDTPISEIAIVGVAIGAAMAGLRPVAEIMYMDFLQISMEQLGTQLSKIRFMSGGQLKVPMVVRTQYSLGRVHGSQHSQFFPSWFLQLPGLKVVLPSTPYDAKGLIKSSIRDGNPVIFIECGVLYRSKGLIPEDEYIIPLGKGEIKRKGNDVTIVAFSRTVQEALEAADKLSGSGVEAEVIDPRTVQPMDYDTIFESVKRTNRLVIVEDSVEAGGLGAEITAKVLDEAFDSLDAPIRRVAAPNMPTPFSPTLERAFMPSADRVVQTVMGLLK